jgi:hypothetical protein
MHGIDHTQRTSFVPLDVFCHYELHHHTLMFTYHRSITIGECAKNEATIGLDFTSRLDSLFDYRVRFDRTENYGRPIFENDDTLCGYYFGTAIASRP